MTEREMPVIPDACPRPDRRSRRKDRLQFRDAVASHNPFNLNATAHKWMDLAMIGIGSRRQAVHAETFTGMKMF